MPAASPDTLIRPAWPPGGGEMAGRIRRHDWAATSLGPAESWPADLRAVVGLMLASQAPMLLLWGRPAVQIYNDACARLVGPQHPAALGGPMSASSLVAEADLHAVLAGRTVQLHDQLHPVLRAGVSEDAWFDTLCSPAGDGFVRNAPGGALCIFTDTTARVLAERRRAGVEAALREGEQRFRTMTDAAPILIWEADATGLTFCNGHALEFSGADFDTLRAKGWASFLHPDDAPDYLRAYCQAFTERRPYAHEARFRRADGQYRWLCSTGRPLGTDRFAGGAFDLTDLRDARDQLRENAALLGGFAEASTDVLWIADTEGGRLEYLSPSFERIWGEPRERVMQELGRWAELVHPDDRAEAASALRRLLAGEALVAIQYRIVRPSDGAVRWVRDSGFPIRSEDGVVRRVGGIARDITERRGTEAALRATGARLKLLTERIPQMVWTAVDGGKWTGVGPQWTEYTGRSEADSLGLNWLDTLHPDDRTLAMAAWDGAAEAGRLDAEYRIRAADGSYRWFHTRATPLAVLPAEDAMEWFGTSTDVHDMRELQERQAVMVAELQHRTRNLIAVVRSIASQTMGRVDSLSAFRTAFNDRLSALSRVQGLLSRSEAEPITIGALLRTELDALGAASDRRVQVAGPEVRLRNSFVQTLALALHELATNARKYGALAGRQGHLHVSWRVHEKGARPHLFLEWVETGIEVQNPAERSRGYGRELIERALPYALGARTSYELGERFVRCTIELPLDKQAGAGPAPP